MTTSEFEILSNEQLEEGDCNDNPNTVLHVRGPNGDEGWVAGPHGVDCCALGDWLASGSPLAATREQAIAEGCN